MVTEVIVLRKIRLRDARAQLGLTMADLARLAGVNWQTISKSEKGGIIRITSAHLILKALNAQRAKEKLYPLTLKSLDWKIEDEPEENE